VATTQIQVLERGENVLRFRVSGIDVSLANSLRRIMMVEVPSMAIDTVVVIENSSAMNDEVLAHRLGLIPLKTALDAYVLPKHCTCNSELGCSRCSVTLTVEADAQEGTRTVYSKEVSSMDPEVVPVSGKIPLVKLTQGQKIRLEAYARLGLGLDHVKWQPTACCTHKYVAAIHVDHETCTLCHKCVDACLRQVLAMNDQVHVVALENCTLCKACEKACPVDAIQVDEVKDAFIFTVESTGVLPPERIFLEAIRILQAKTEELTEAVTQIKAGEAE
jgi:DNA-directed RNA polymerase subunit D